MKRLGLVLGLTALLSLSVTGVAAADDDGYSAYSSRDWVFGSIKRTALNGTGERIFSIAAVETRNGGAVGFYSAIYKPEGISYQGRVTCLNVIGRNAMVGIQITKSNDSEATVGKGEFIRVTDYGPPTVTGQRDSISPGAFTASGPTVCPTPVLEATPTIGGNVLVHDGHP